MASLSRNDHEFDADFWADLAARVLGVVAAFGLAVLGLVLLFPAGGIAGHLPALPLGAAEPQRPLIGLLCFALSGIVATAVMLRRPPEPPIRGPAPLPREMNLAPAGSAEAPVLAPFPVAQPWRAPPPPMADTSAIEALLRSTPPSPEPASEPAPFVMPPSAPAIVLPEPPPEVAPLVASEAEESEPAPAERVEIEAELPAAPSDTTPLIEAEAVESVPAEAAAEPAPTLVEEDFDTRRERLKATLGEASVLAAALTAQAANDHQHSLAAQDVGDIALASGAPDQAGDAYDRALVHARALMEAHPEAPTVRSVLAEVLVKIGDLNTARGRMGAAFDAYEEALVHRREAARDSEDEAPRLDLAAALEKLAQLRQARGETDKARALYTESLEHLAPLTAADPRYGDMAYRAKLSLLGLDS